jgi:asparagine synthase (glutamine-hydrolysing)
VCGIAGFIDPRTADLEMTCRAMGDALIHRGPDDGGFWVEREVGLGLAHRRLSIVEIVFNGEIYNHVDLRRQLDQGSDAALPWRGHSDTETLLAAIESYGLQRTLQRCVGMFALAIWDRQRRVLTLARDRLGEKPLYYGRSGGAFLFGSELKALRAHEAFDSQVDTDCLALYLRHCYVPEPYSIFRGICRLPPASTVEIDRHGHPGQPVAYWSAAQVASQANQFTGSDLEAVATLERVLSEAVGLQMVADVPLGAFLSGGIDSSLIVALMQKQAARKVNTFTIGFSEPKYDESGYARAVARHLGTQHTALIVSPAQAMEVIPRLSSIYDEPFADSSQIPTFLVSQLARQHVTVALSGDGGDELFGGYNRYAWAKRLSGAVGLPKPVRQMAARAIRAFSADDWGRFFTYAKHVMPRSWQASHMGHKLHKFADLMQCSRGELYLSLVSHCSAPEKVVNGATEPSTPLSALIAEPTSRGFEESMMYWDLVTYLPNDILVKVDRAAMAVSLETRVPMLDHRVVEFAWSLPLHMRVRAGRGKWLLKQLLSRYVPPALTERPKVGFGIPINTWLRGPLRDWAEDLLDESRLRREGFFNAAAVREKWLAHNQGRQDWAYWLWDILMFQSWWQDQRSFTRKGPASAPALAVRREAR